MDDEQAHKIIREMLDQEVAASMGYAIRLQQETEEYERDPSPDTAAIIKRFEEKHKGSQRRAEALAIAVSKF